MAETLKLSPYIMYSLVDENDTLLGCIGYRIQGINEIDLGCIIAARGSSSGTGEKLLLTMTTLLYPFNRKFVIGSHPHNEAMRQCALNAGFTEVTSGRYEWQKHSSS